MHLKSVDTSSTRMGKVSKSIKIGYVKQIKVLVFFIGLDTSSVYIDEV